MGDGEGPVFGHALEFVPCAPGVGIEEFVCFIVIADDDTHVAADGLEDAGLWEDAEGDAPDDGDALVDLCFDTGEELFVVGVFGTHAFEDFWFHGGAHFAHEDGVAMREFGE